MNLLAYVIIAVLVLAVLAAAAAGALGFGAALLYWLTGIFHAFKPQEAPGPNDGDWSPDQGREAR